MASIHVDLMAMHAGMAAMKISSELQSRFPANLAAQKAPARLRSRLGRTYAVQVGQLTSQRPGSNLQKKRPLEERPLNKLTEQPVVWLRG